MAKPTNAIKGFIRLTHPNSKEVLVNVANIGTVRSSGEHAFVLLLASPFNSNSSQELNILETYDEVIKRIIEAS